MVRSWPFSDPPNLKVITLRRIIQGNAPILYVRHEPDAAGWQFLDGKPIAPGDAVIVSLSQIMRLDGSLSALAGLPVGWQASRDKATAPWQQTRLEHSREHAREHTAG